MEVIAHAVVAGVSVFLGFLLYLFFCLLHSSYAALLGVLLVFLLLGGFTTF